MAEHRVRIVAWTALVTLPLAGLSLLLAAPTADVHWEHHPAHFWLVLGAAAISAIARLRHRGRGLAGAATRRLFLVSLAFLAAAGFLGLHALATPGVLLDGPNAGSSLATPVGLLVARRSSPRSARR